MFRKFSIPIRDRGRNNLLFNEIADLAKILLCNKLNKIERNDVISIIDDKVCELYCIPKCELQKNYQPVDRYPIIK